MEREEVTRGNALNCSCSPCTLFRTSLLGFGELPEGFRQFLILKPHTGSLHVCRRPLAFVPGAGLLSSSSCFRHSTAGTSFFFLVRPLSKPGKALRISKSLSYSAPTPKVGVNGESRPKCQKGNQSTHSFVMCRVWSQPLSMADKFATDSC